MDSWLATGRKQRFNAHWFLSLADAYKTLEDWCRYYNEERLPWRNWPVDADFGAQSRWRRQKLPTGDPMSASLQV
jgi:hypothetical protein